jgi:hypothetical protein
MAGLSSKLVRLVEAADDPELTVYAYTHLIGLSSTTGNDPGGFGGSVDRVRKHLLPLLAQHGISGILSDVEEQQLSLELFQQASLNLLLHRLQTQHPDDLRLGLKDKNPFIRLLTVQTIGRRHVHLERNLIDCVNDPNPAIREVAHHALVQCARGTDFGPIPGASQTGIARSVEKWQHWLALQRGDFPDTTVEGKTAVTSTGSKVDPAKAVKLVLDHGNRELQTVPSQVTQLCDELVKAKGDEQMSVLARLRDAKGIDNTDALALAIPKLSAGAAQREARDALAQRLTRMTAKTVRDKLQDDSVEVRRAAALACGRKKADEHIPDLLQLLEDPEVAVIQAARKALMELTGEDFGPTEEAGRKGRASAAAAWRKWYEERPRESK